MLHLHAGNLSISITSCMEGEISVVVCQGNSSILEWSVNHTTSGLVDGVTSTTIPDRRGFLVSTLVVNTSMYSARSERMQIRCFNERAEGQVICVKFDRRCIYEVGCDGNNTDCKFSTYMCHNNYYYHYNN